MDTQAIAIQHLETLGWPYTVDLLDGDIVTGFGMDVDGTLHPISLQIIPSATQIDLRARRIAGSGGREERFEPGVAALVAILAYDVNLHLGVDTRDGEIEARTLVHLGVVPPEQQLRLFAHVWDDFLAKCVRVTRIIIETQAAQQPAVEQAESSIDLRRPIPASA